MTDSRGLPPRRRARLRSTRASALVVVLLLLVAVAGLVGGAAPAAAAACDGGLGGREAFGHCVGRVPGTGSGSSASGGGGGSAPSGPRYRYRYVLTCDGNTPDDPTATLCDRAANACEAPARFYWQYRSTDGVAWQLVGTRCLTPQQVAEGEAVPDLTLEDFRRLPIPPQEVRLEPGNGFALVGVPLNAVAGTAPAVLQTTVLGASVAVRATPVAYTWDFGDGTVLGPTADPGAPYPALGTTHTYERGGDVSVVLTTTYAGEFSVEGGAFTAVGGTAEVASAPVPLAVLTGAGALVGDVTG